MRTKFAALALATVMAAAISGPASAGAGSVGGAALAGVAPDQTVDAQYRSRARGYEDGPYWQDRSYGWGRDNVGSLTYGGGGYAVNNFSGQVYTTCQEDLGYGRVRPCDAGSR